MVQVAKLAAYFAIPWFAGNFAYQMALAQTEVAVVNVLSSTSCLFTLILSAIFPSSENGDKFTLSKLLAVFFSMVGVFLVSYADLNLEDGVPVGAIWTLIGALFYAIYIVLLRRKVAHEDNMDSPMFFGFVGAFNALFLWPGLALFHVSGVEPFEAPTTRQLEFLIVNGLIGTVLSELLWLLGCFYTSSLVATLAIGLTIPLSVLADIAWKGKSYGAVFYAGAAPMFVSFFVVAMLTHYEDWDPVADFLRSLFPRRRSTAIPMAQEREALINDSNDSSQTNEDI